jgi:RNA polymerase sigma-70 factor (ECF subfamily)
MSASAHDIALLDRLRAGDEAAFSQLVDQHHAALVRLAQTMLHDSGAAEEVVQETWIAFISGLARFEGRSSLRTWIFGILINQTRRHARSTWRERATADETMEQVIQTQLGGFDETGHWLHRPAAWPGSDDPEAQVARRQLLDALSDAIAALPETQRAIVTMRDVEGLDAAEICEILGMNDGQLRVALHRARLQLRRALEDTFLNKAGSP